MRVAVISAHTSPLARPGGNKTGGLNVYVRGLAQQLVAPRLPAGRQGCQVDIFSRAASPGTPELTELAPGLRVIHLRAGPARFLAPESVYKHLDAFGQVGERLKAAWRLPHVAMFHTLGEIKNRASLSEHETELRIRSEQAVIRGADRVICATEQERDLIRKLYAADPAKITVIPLGVDLDRFRPADKESARAALGLRDERIILFVGRLEPLKGVDILINAAAMLESDVDCSVLIVGGDPSAPAQLRRLRDLARERGIEHRVAFAGAVDHERLPLYYNAADVCVVPSHYESFGLVAIEAMASGVPVVASRVGGLAGTVKDGETGYLVPWLCPEPFAERIDMLLENESLRRNLGEAAREAVGRYRWENVADAVLQLYNDLVGTPALLPTGTTS